MAAARSLSLSLSSLHSLPSSSDLTNPNPLIFLPLANRYCSLPRTLSSLSLQTATGRLGTLRTPRRTPTEIGRLRAAASGDASVTPIPAPANTAATEQIISASSNSGDGVSTIISILLGIAFIGLSIVTIGVIYIAVTDFLQKREKEKFEKEEAEANKKRKKGGKKNRVRARAGPRGFGQKIKDDEFDD